MIITSQNEIHVGDGYIYFQRTIIKFFGIYFQTVTRTFISFLYVFVGTDVNTLRIKFVDKANSDRGDSVVELDGSILGHSR